MFTQKISMECTREQYEKYLKDELLKMGYEEFMISKDRYWRDVIVNNHVGSNGIITDMYKDYSLDYDRHYLGSFNAPLFLALAAMTDKAEGNYGEYVIGLNTGAFHRMSGEDRILPEYKYIRKATKEEIMAKFGEKKCTNNTLENNISALMGILNILEVEAINLLKSKGYKILKPKTWEEI